MLEPFFIFIFLVEYVLWHMDMVNLNEIMAELSYLKCLDCYGWFGAC